MVVGFWMETIFDLDLVWISTLLVRLTNVVRRTRPTNLSQLFSFFNDDVQDESPWCASTRCPKSEKSQQRAKQLSSASDAGCCPSVRVAAQASPPTCHRAQPRPIHSPAPPAPHGGSEADAPHGRRELVVRSRRQVDLCGRAHGHGRPLPCARRHCVPCHPPRRSCPRQAQGSSTTPHLPRSIGLLERPA